MQSDTYRFSAEEVIARMDQAGSMRTPFFFALDYELRDGIFIEQPLGQELSNGFSFSIGEYKTEEREQSYGYLPQILKIGAESQERYAKRFDVIRHGLMHGDSFLANLTIRTPIALKADGLRHIYDSVRARYRVFVPEQFVCFSPECFVQIRGCQISTFPMKGTIDASIPNAEHRLKEDYKESCEHATIVDLMRNDLSRIATQVYVDRYKYLDRISTSRGEILQMSSKVVGTLPDNWHEQVGTLIATLLPAGSISGAPKQRTCAMIKQAEEIERGFYTGVAGYFDGDHLDSGVLIRFIELSDDQYYYRSGGGITINSDMKDEYAECLQKIYLPSAGNDDLTKSEGNQPK